MLSFEWDETKARMNLRKHGISFDESLPVFWDDNVLIEEDSVVNGEQRWTAMGRIGGSAVLLVVHTSRQEGTDEVVRIISARKADAKERRRYGKNRSKNT
jgi:uncharacterized DUF497 family protein